MKTIVIIILAILVCTTSAWAGGVGDAVEVRIVTDDGRTLPTYPVIWRTSSPLKREEALRDILSLVLAAAGPWQA